MLEGERGQLVLRGLLLRLQLALQLRLLALELLDHQPQLAHLALQTLHLPPQPLLRLSLPPLRRPRRTHLLLQEGGQMLLLDAQAVELL